MKENTVWDMNMVRIHGLLANHPCTSKQIQTFFYLPNSTVVDTLHRLMKQKVVGKRSLNMNKNQKPEVEYYLIGEQK